MDLTGSEAPDLNGDLPAKAVQEISKGLRHLLADVFALYSKTKNLHWRMTGIHFRDYHLLLDDHRDQIFAMTNPVIASWDRNEATLRREARAVGIRHLSCSNGRISGLVLSQYRRELRSVC